MKHASTLRCAVTTAGVVARAAQPAPSDAAPGRFEYRLQQAAALTSAGVYDRQGRLVRALWTTEPRATGRHTVDWDGLDDFTNAGHIQLHEWPERQIPANTPSR